MSFWPSKTHCTVSWIIWSALPLYSQSSSRLKPQPFTSSSRASGNKSCSCSIGFSMTRPIKAWYHCWIPMCHRSISQDFLKSTGRLVGASETCATSGYSHLPMKVGQRNPRSLLIATPGDLVEAENTLNGIAAIAGDLRQFLVEKFRFEDLL